MIPAKRGYTLFHPTPEPYLRELSTHRPDQTESPYTVDAGHVQVEMDVASVTLDADRSDVEVVQSTEWSLMATNLKVGLLHNLDLQIVFDTYIHSRVEQEMTGSSDQISGFGNVQTRVKFNLWGNDGGSTALALMPYLKWPLAESHLRNGHTEGGLIIPLAVGLPRGWGLGLMTEFDVVRNPEQSGYETIWVNTITLGRDLVGPLGGFVEFVASFNLAGSAHWEGPANVGFTIAISDDVQFDLGSSFGITESAPDFTPFLGLSFRL
jgi:hypothetical protein